MVKLRDVQPGQSVNGTYSVVTCESRQKPDEASSYLRMRLSDGDAVITAIVEQPGEMSFLPRKGIRIAFTKAMSELRNAETILVLSPKDIVRMG